jgi:hypothetical protein
MGSLRDAPLRFAHVVAEVMMGVTTEVKSIEVVGMSLLDG